MIKNSIVLMDEINANLASGNSPYDATVEAGVSRVRPVVLGAATTILGVVPLLQDAFWVSMSMTIMSGLTFGTVITWYWCRCCMRGCTAFPHRKAARNE
jgi:multidrug efflux pump subunit AcrB